MLPPGSGDVVVIVSAGLMEMLRLSVAVFAAESVTLTMKLKVSAAVGLPVIAPVPAVKLKPVGQEPELTVHV